MTVLDSVLQFFCVNGFSISMYKISLSLKSLWLNNLSVVLKFPLSLTVRAEIEKFIRFVTKYGGNFLKSC